MDRLGIERSYCSVSSPGVRFGDVDLARAVNEAGRRAVVDHPSRFGLLASLPLPDVDAAIAEIAYCCDHLDVDGFVLITNVEWHLPGRRVVRTRVRRARPPSRRVLVHPTSPACWEHTSLGRPRPMLEFLFDTTRTVVDLVLNGTIADEPGPRAHRPARRRGAAVARRPRRRVRRAARRRPDVDVLRDLGRLHFDLAGYAVPRQLDALLTMTTVDHLHYGSDYPFTPEPVVAGRPPSASTAWTISCALRTNTERLFTKEGRP